jgi:hypothetical protein
MAIQVSRLFPLYMIVFLIKPFHHIIPWYCLILILRDING